MKNFSLHIFIIFLFSLVIFIQPIYAQIEILPGPAITPDDMVENIVGDGIEYSNVTFQGAAGSRGIFNNGGATNLGIESGIFLTSGSGYVIPGPNTGSSSGTSNNLGGHPLLTGITSGTTFDACVLEFDFIPESDTLRFRFKFGSDEYNEYVGSTFNDVFGFFVTGPNPDGGMYTNTNVAVIPSTNISVTINNVNNGYANAGVVPTGPCTNCAFFSDNTGGLTLEYDAFTTVMTATLKVVPCQTYSISIGVADVGDHIFDSGVFIEENSFESPKIEVETDPFPQGVSDNMIEGCVEADIIFSLPHAEYAPITICFEIVQGPGYATNGVDYEEIEDCVTFEEGQDTAFIHIVPLNDDIIEGDELIQLIIENTLGCIVRYDTVEFTIVDYVDMITQTSGNTLICEGQEIDIGLNTFNGIPPYTFEWDEIATSNDTITVSPDTTTMYHITVIDMCMDTVSDSLNVMVFPTPDIDLGNDSAVICEGDTLLLEPGAGYGGYSWQDGSIEPTYTVTEPGLYFVTVSGAGGCTSSDSIYVELSYMEIYLGADTTICVGDTMTLNAGSGFTSYNWQDGSSGSTYSVTVTGLYYVDVTQDGCSDTDSIYVYVDDPAISVDLGNDVIVCQGEEVILEPLFGVFISYLWSTGDTTSKITVTEPGTYSLSVVSGCGDANDEVSVSFFDYPDPNLGPDLQLCEEETVTIWSETMTSYRWQDNSTNPFFTVTTSGLYYVDVTDNNGCAGTDTVYAEVGTTVNILEDSMLVCTGESINIDAGYGFDFYTWSNGEYGVQTIDVTEGGKYYSVNVNYLFGCPSSDSVYVSELPKPDAIISGDDEICTGDTLLLTAPKGPFTYSWNGGPSTDQTTYVAEHGGEYNLTMVNACGTSNDQVSIHENPLPEPDLGPDELLFPGESVTLNPGNYTTYLWQDGSNQASYIVSYEDINVLDTFWVEVFDGLCKNSDKIKVEVFNVEIPNAMTPNGDGFNDTFEPTTPLTGVNSHNMTIFNRWGQKVWETDNFEDGWDGKQNGRYVDEGTYFWILEVYYGNENVNKIYKGSLTILGTGS